MDTIKFNFVKLTSEYKEQDDTGKLLGPIQAWFDLKQNKGG
jgi:hypothetical protein